MKNRHFWVLKNVLGRASKTSGTQARTYRILGQDQGQYASMENWDCRNSAGQEIPWYTYPAIEYLQNFDLAGLNVLEYGSGNSSIFYLNAGAHVTSIENDKGWFDKITQTVGAHPQFRYVFEDQEQAYATRAEILGADIVIIDGRFRNTCARYVLQQLRDGAANPAMIIFDNADWYPTGVAMLDDGTGWHRCDFNGFGPINPYTWTTSVYLNPGRVLPRKSALAPIGGLTQISDEDR